MATDATEDRTIDVEKIRDMKTAAILGMCGFEIVAAQLVKNTSRVVFSHIVGRHRKAEFDEIVRLCGQGYGLRMVASVEQVNRIAAMEDPEAAFAALPTLGGYERAFRGVRHTIDAVQKETNKEAQTDG